MNNQQHTKAAKEFQKLTEISHEIHQRVINIFKPVYVKPEAYNHMPYNYPALKDTILDIVYNSYSRVVYDVSVEMDERMHVHVTLHFCFDKAERSFMLTEYSFEDQSC